MSDSSAVLGLRNGDVGSDLLFVAEAPGRLGAARTGIPLHGDQSGRNFEQLLDATGFLRDDVFITNAVLCNPRDAMGRNARPSAEEIRNCRFYLERTLDIVDPKVVVALGAVALWALGQIAPHQLTLKQDVGTATNWNGRVLMPLYHPSSRGRIHRPFELQIQDFFHLRRVLMHLRRM